MSLIKISFFVSLFVVISSQKVIIGSPKDENNLIIKYQSVLYKEKDGRRLAEILYSQNDFGSLQMVDCFLTGDPNVANILLEEIPADLTKIVDLEAMNKLIDACSTFLSKRLNAGNLHDFTRNSFQGVSSLNRGFLDSLAIFPGTKWCGAGNVASHYEDLGLASETDMCCRTHDHCENSIGALQEKYGLKNKAIFTKSHCDCDRVFTDCLKKADSTVATSVGRGYYNLLQVQCFEMNHPVEKCLKKSGLIPFLYWSCQEYKFDLSGEKCWQFFDAKYFQ